MAADRTWSVGTVTGVTSANNAHLTVATGTTTPVITMVSAPKFTTARNINGISFDGTADITITASPNIAYPSDPIAITMATAFQPRAGGPCQIVVTGGLTGLVGLLETVTIGVSSTSGGTFKTVTTDQLLIGVLGQTLSKSVGTFDIPTGAWVKVTRSGTAATATYVRIDK